MTKDNLSELAAAALALDVELKRFEEVSDTAIRMKLNSEKNLERAAEAIGRAGQGQVRIGEQVRALVQAIQSAREKQEREAAALQARAEELQQRRARYSEMFAQMGALGEDAKAIQELLIAARDGGPDAAAKLEEVRGRMEKVGLKAEEIRAAADAEEMEDLSRQATSLRDQVLAARNKLQLLANKVAGPADA